MRVYKCNNESKEAKQEPKEIMYSVRELLTIAPEGVYKWKSVVAGSFRWIVLKIHTSTNCVLFYNGKNVLMSSVQVSADRGFNTMIFTRVESAKLCFEVKED